MSRTGHSHASVRAVPHAVRGALWLLAAMLPAAPSVQAGSFDFAALQTLLRSQDIGSVEQLLAALPAPQRARYALVFNSRSLQGATPELPRVILFGPDARLILTFNGSPAQRGFRVVETMEFDDAGKEFRLRELVFPERAAGADQVQVSEVNPTHCARCHGAPPRPVWDSFPLWPGAYGERYGARLTARERAGLAAFLALQPTHPRYRQLLGVQRFADPETFHPSAVGQYGALAQEPPNAELGTALSRLQSQAIVRELVRQPAFASYQYALLGVADSSCGGLAEFYPDALWRQRRGALERFARDTAAANAREAQLKAARAADGGFARTARAARAASSDNALVQLRFLAESALGVDTRAWTLALEKGTYDFTLPPPAAQPLREGLLAEVAARDAAVQDLSRYSSSSDGDRYCNYLKRRSRAALGDPSKEELPYLAGDAAAAPSVAPGGVPGTPGAAGASAGPTSRPAALQLCINCHETGVAPPVPFSDPEQLTRQLRVRPSAHGTLIDEIRFRLSAAAGTQHMPLGVNLSEADRESLERYFTALASTPN
jgi:cytochrome c553